MTERWHPAWEWSGPPHIRVEYADLADEDHHWRQHRVVTQHGRPGVVVIAHDTRWVALVRVRRPVVNGTLLELPRGFGETSPEEDACRELLEETGLAASSLHVIGGFVTDSGLMPTRIAVFDAVVDRSAPSEPLDDDAVREVVWVDRAELPQLVADGQLRDGLTLAALACWWSPQR